MLFDKDWEGGRRFCDVHKISGDECEQLRNTCESIFSISSSDIPPGARYYVPVVLDDYNTLNSESGGEIVFRKHHDPKQVTARYCNTIGSGTDCDHAYIENLVLTASQKNLPSVPRLLLELQITDINGWTTYTPHTINKRYLRVWEGETPMEAAIAFCWYEKCPDVLGVTEALVMVAKQYLGIEDDPDVPPNDASAPRVVVSFTSLPGRLEHVTQTLNYFLRGQTKLPDKIYVNLPTYSVREGRAYSIPENLHQYIESLDNAQRSIVVLNVVKNDYGPATKLLPTLLEETDPSTIIVTVDDDVFYPDFYLEDLYKAATRYPDKAVGYVGYRVNPGGEGYVKFDSQGLEEDLEVDVLGGVTGIAYRRALLHAPAMFSYLYHPVEAFYVDDDYISGQLGRAGRGKVVLGNSRVGNYMFSTDVIKPVSEIFSLNGKRSFRNKEFQNTILKWFEAEGAWNNMKEWREEFMESFYKVLDMRKDSFYAVFDLLLKMEKSSYNIIETGTTQGFNHWMESGQSTLMWDRFVNTGGRSGGVISIDLDKNGCERARRITSDKVKVINGDSVETLKNLAAMMEETGETVDVIYLDSWDVTTENWEGGNGGDDAPALHAFRELEAILPMLSAGGIVLVDDNMIENLSSAEEIRELFYEFEREQPGRPWVYDESVGVRGKGRLVKEYMDGRLDCKRFYYGWQMAWVC